MALTRPRSEDLGMAIIKALMERLRGEGSKALILGPVKDLINERKLWHVGLYGVDDQVTVVNTDHYGMDAYNSRGNGPEVNDSSPRRLFWR